MTILTCFIFFFNAFLTIFLNFLTDFPAGIKISRKRPAIMRERKPKKVENTRRILRLLSLIHI